MSKCVNTDVQKLAHHFLKAQIFQEKIPRNHYAFTTIHRNPLTSLNLISLQIWMVSKIKEFASHQHT